MADEAVRVHQHLRFGLSRPSQQPLFPAVDLVARGGEGEMARNQGRWFAGG